MLEYRYMQDGGHDAETLKHFLDNLPLSKFDVTYSDDLNANLMSMSVPNARYFESFCPPSNLKQETEYFNETKNERNVDTKAVAYPTYIRASESLKALNCEAPKEIVPFDHCFSMCRSSVKPRNSARGYDSEPNWSDLPIKSIDKKTLNFHDQMTRKRVERGTNNFRRASMSLNIVKQWNEFDDENHSKFVMSKRRRNLADQLLASPNTPRKSNHSVKLTEKTKKEHDTETKQFNQLSREISDCKGKHTTTEVRSGLKTEKIQKETSSRKSPLSTDSGSDEVFESPNRKPNPRFIKRRSSSLDALASNPPFPLNPLTNRNRSSVSIKDEPEYYEFDPKSFALSDLRNPSNSIANSASTFHKSLGTTPKRASLKKSSNEHLKQCSDYDVRDRGRGRNGNSGRDSYRDRHHRERDSDRGLSDREQRESYNTSSFNRSMSNAEGTPDDKIGKRRFTVFLSYFK